MERERIRLLPRATGKKRSKSAQRRGVLPSGRKLRDVRQIERQGNRPILLSTPSKRGSTAGKWAYMWRNLTRPILTDRHLGGLFSGCHLGGLFLGLLGAVTLANRFVDGRCFTSSDCPPPQTCSVQTQCIYECSRDDDCGGGLMTDRRESSSQQLRESMRQEETQRKSTTCLR